MRQDIVRILAMVMEMTWARLMPYPGFSRNRRRKEDRQYLPLNRRTQVIRMMRVRKRRGRERGMPLLRVMIRRRRERSLIRPIPRRRRKSLNLSQSLRLTLMKRKRESRLLNSLRSLRIA